MGVKEKFRGRGLQEGEEKRRRRARMREAGGKTQVFSLCEEEGKGKGGGREIRGG